MRIPCCLWLSVAAAAAVPTPSVATRPLDGPFSPPSFFVGHMEGRGNLSTIFSRSSSVAVHGTGHIDGAGTLVLDQTIERPGIKTRHREWRLVETALGHFGGSLSDATRSVAGVVLGNDFHVRYRIKGAISVDQHLELQPGGQVIQNRMLFRKFGVIVARMAETIRRTG